MLTIKNYDFNYFENLKHILNLKHISLRELAIMINHDDRSLYGYDRRNSIPPADLVYKIADVLEVSVEYLLTGIDRNIVKLDDFEKLNQEEVLLINQMIQLLIKNKGKNNG